MIVLNEITCCDNDDSVLVTVSDARLEKEIRDLSKGNPDINILLPTPQLVAMLPLKYLHFHE